MEHDPERRTVTLRDGVDGRVLVEWYIGTAMSSFLRVFTGRDDKELLVALDEVELPQAARALRSTLAGDKDAATVRDLGFEKVSLEAESGYVTLSKRTPGKPGQMTVLGESEARQLLEAVETAIDEFGDVEDDPHV